MGGSSVGLFYCFILSDGILLVEKLAAPPPPHWPQMYLKEKLRSQVVNKFFSTVHKFEAFISKFIDIRRAFGASMYFLEPKGGVGGRSVGLFYCLILSGGILLVEQLAPPPPPTGHKCI